MSDLTDEQLLARLEELQHAMQSGVKMTMDIDPAETSPKSLRVGVNSEMVFNAALVKLLVRKGVITDREYIEAIVFGIEEEVARYEKELSKHFGSSIKLG